MKEQEPKSRAQFLEERVANSCLSYQSKHGFDTAFDLILEDVIELRKMVNSVSGETPKPDLDMAGYWRREYFKAHICEEELTGNYLEALVLLNEAKDAQMNSNLPARIKMFLDGETETKTKYSELTGGSVPTPNDEEIEAEIQKLPYVKHLDDGQFNDGVIHGFELGAKWVKEWLRSSTEQRLGKDADKG